MVPDATHAPSAPAHFFVKPSYVGLAGSADSSLIPNLRRVLSTTAIMAIWFGFEQYPDTPWDCQAAKYIYRLPNPPQCSGIGIHGASGIYKNKYSIIYVLYNTINYIYIHIPLLRMGQAITKKTRLIHLESPPGTSKILE